MAFKWRKDRDARGTKLRSARIISDNGEDVGEITIETSKTNVNLNFNLRGLTKLKHMKDDSDPRRE